MTIIQPPALAKHVLRLARVGVGVGVLGVLGAAVGGDVAADVGEEVRAVAGGGDGGFEAGELGAVLLEDLAVAG